MKIIYFIFFLAISLIKGSASSDLGHAMDKGNIASFRLEHRSHLSTSIKSDHSVTMKEVLDVICTVKERAITYEGSQEPGDRVFTRANVDQVGRSESAFVPSCVGMNGTLPPRFKKTSVDCSPINKSIAQVVPHPNPIKLDDAIVVSIRPDVTKIRVELKAQESPKEESVADSGLEIDNAKKSSALEPIIRKAKNTEVKYPYPEGSPALDARVSVGSCIGLKPIRLSGSVRYKDSRASSEVIQSKDGEEDKLDDEYLEPDQVSKRGSLECYKRDAAPIMGRPMHHCARRSLEYGGASSVYIPENRCVHKATQLTRSVSDVAYYADNYAIDFRDKATDMLASVLGKVCLISGPQVLDDGNVLKLELMLLFSNLHEQYLLNPDYKSAEFCKLLINRKYLIVFLLNNEYMIRTGRLTSGISEAVFRHNIIGGHVLKLAEALKSNLSTGNSASTPISPGRLYHTIGAPQIIQHEIMSRNEFITLGKAFLDLYESGALGEANNPGSSSSSLRDRPRSISSTVGRRMSAASDYPRSLGTVRLPRERSNHAAAIRQLEALDNRIHFSFCSRCMLL